MQSWSSGLDQKDQTYLKEGLIKTLVTLNNISVEQARNTMEEFVQRDMRMNDMYAYLQDRSDKKFFVDKSPTYAFSLETLKNAEQVSDSPLYVHLVRHPLSVISSFVENRFDKLFKFEGEPWQKGEEIWRSINHNIETCLKDVPSDRVLTLRYEDIVVGPQQSMESICRWLQVESDTSMIEPYKGERMRGGLHDKSIPIGDPNFNTHSGIESGLAEVWKKHMNRVSRLDDSTLEMAKKYGYDLSVKDSVV